MPITFCSRRRITRGSAEELYDAERELVHFKVDFGWLRQTSYFPGTPA